MFLKEVRIQNFRVYSEIAFPLEQKLTIITGPNGIGKTSILEAVSFLGSTRSFRFGKNEDFIHTGKDMSTLQGEVEEDGLTNKVQINISASRKNIFLNQKKQTRQKEMLKTLPFIVFSPGDHEIIEGGSLERRVFLNNFLSNLDFIYGDVLRKYKKVLFQRNLLLKENKGELRKKSIIEKNINAWDTQFVQFASFLIKSRSKGLKVLELEWNKYYEKISGKSHRLEATYFFNNRDTIENLENIEDFLWKELAKNLEKDILRCTTSVGPHRDEIILTLDGKKLKNYASQGEKRTAVLALRLAEAVIFKAQHKRNPILLIDDISSELDHTRRRALVHFLRQGDSQVIMTATELPMDLLREIDSPFEHIDLTKKEEKVHNRYSWESK